MTLYLVRHAQAGSKVTWNGSDDRLRPLTAEGRHQAADLVGTLWELGVERVLSSPFVRCLETVAPLAARLGLPLETDESFAEGSPAGAIDFMRKVGDENVVVCSHGDIIPELLHTVSVSDAVDLGRDPRCQKGSVWILEPRPAGFTQTVPAVTKFKSASYIAPPR